MNEVIDYDNIWCSCPECNGVVQIGSQQKHKLGGSYDAKCPGCGHSFQYMYEETTEEIIDKTVVNFEKLKRKKKIGQLIKQLKLKGYIE